MSTTNQALADRLKFLEKEFGIVIPPERLAGWDAELSSGTGRDIESLWGDILKHVVGSDALKGWFQEEFTSRGLTVASGSETEDQRLDRLVSEFTQGSRRFDEFRRTLDSFSGNTSTGGNVPTTQGPNPGESITTTGVGGAGQDEDTALTILTAKNMKWFFDSKSGLYYVGYGLPNSSRMLVFEATPVQMDSLFGKGMRPVNYETVTGANELFQREGVTFGGDITSMAGTGSFEGAFDQAITRGLDDGALPDWAQASGEILDIIYIGYTQGKAPEWYLDQISKTASFTQRFPGIKALQTTGNLGLAEAISGFLEYEAMLKGLELQYGGAEDNITPAKVAALMQKGYSASMVTEAYAVGRRLQNNASALSAFNQILVANGGAAMNTVDMINFLKGNAPAEVYDLYEAASFREGAEAHGLEKYMSAEDAINAAMETEGTADPQAIFGAFSDAATSLLRLRHEVDMNKYGLNHEDLVDVSLGLKPRSGAMTMDIVDNIQRAQNEAHANRNNFAPRPYYSFTEEGRSQGRGLGTGKATY